MKMLIRGGHLMDPAAGRDGVFDLLVQDGIVAELKEWTNSEAPVWKQEEMDKVIDASGKYVMPGFIDLHVHLREPGLEYKETIATGAMAAAAGGFTSVCPMPNTKPSTDTPEKIRALLEKAKTDAKIHILPIGAISIGQEGKELADIQGMAEAGAVAFSEDGKSVMNSALYAEGMKAAAKAGRPVFAHCEDIDLVRGGVMNAGKRAEELGLPGITNAVEDIITARDIFLARETGVQLHLCHCSTKDSVMMIALAKAEGLPVSGETGPHYFTMTDAEIPEDFGNYKMNPPLRGAADKEALIQALQDNVLEAIATDHAPHSKEEKEQSMLKAPFGIVGSETAYALTVTELVRTGKITMQQLVERMSASPARILGIQKGSLQPGMAADITIADVDTCWKIDPEKFYSKGKNTPFAGKEVYGKIYYTIVDGEIAFQQE
ncbi:MAG: dihydroorotase [Lachnospiraceae bacterium]|nr:dihydroorotase [Lachnospiraceae bacterium]MBP3610953.1 dihydroorotase [Lachnospiraceae bacterium]